MSSNIEIITAGHDNDICRIIKCVGEEFGAVGEGFGPSDPEVEMMSHFYKEQDASRYFIATLDGVVVGGAGIAAFAAHSNHAVKGISAHDNSTEMHVCELRKLFLLPESRGLGLGKQLAETCLQYAMSKGYSHCYLDTLHAMQSAISLYEKLGFEHLDAPLQGTIHDGCDVWMLKTL